MYTYNHIDEIPMAEPKDGMTIPFMLFDDDNNLYLDGVMTPELYDSPDIMEPLDYAMDAWGCTSIKVQNPKTGKFEII